MIFLYVVELFVAVAIAYVLVTQVVLPLWNDTPLFPFLRFRRVAKELSEVLEQQRMESVEDIILKHMGQTRKYTTTTKEKKECE